MLLKSACQDASILPTTLLKICGISPAPLLGYPCPQRSAKEFLSSLGWEWPGLECSPTERQAHPWTKVRIPWGPERPPSVMWSENRACRNRGISFPTVKTCGTRRSYKNVFLVPLLRSSDEESETWKEEVTCRQRDNLFGNSRLIASWFKSSSQKVDLKFLSVPTVKGLIFFYNKTKGLPARSPWLVL